MRHRHLAWVVGVCVAWGGMVIGGAAQTSPAEQAVMQAIEQVNAAFQQRDVKKYEALTTEDFVRVGSNGRVFGRSEWMKTVAAPGAARQPGKYDQSSVRVFGDGAVVTYRNTPMGADGKPGPVGYLTRVMERQAGQWKMALAQSTDLKPPPAPTGAEPQALPAWSVSSAAEKDALAAFRAIQKANADRDLAAWERLSAADHTIIGADGARTSRAERVAALKAPAAATAANPPPGADQNVRLMVKGDLAAVTWTAGNSRSLKVLARKNGQWQQVLQQSSPIVAGKK
jgi:ketosteroid isomerase-like protein